MTNPRPFESILVVFQNALEGRESTYDDWYTNIHIRDAMRLEGAIATQRFGPAADQPVLDGRRVEPGYFAHTIYEWESAAKSVEGHQMRAGTPLMEIIRDCSFAGLRDYFYRPVFLSHGWTREKGFRVGDEILTALIIPPEGGEADFEECFVARHATDTLGLPGIGSIGLFSLHEEQSLPTPSRFEYVAIYALSDRAAALEAWAVRYDKRSTTDLSAQAQEVEIACWKPRIPRLRSEDVANPSPSALAEEQRARATYANRYLSQKELQALLLAN
jgi:hypothetical protein